jgi:hypothetical protein
MRRLASGPFLLQARGALATQIGTQRGNAGIIADIEGRELLSESVAIDTGKNPLRKIVGRSFGKEMVDAEGLKGVVEDGRVATVLESGEKFGKGDSGSVADASEIRDGEKVERCLCRLHGGSSAPVKFNR